MQGSAKGTSIASKYLSKALPYEMPFKFYTINLKTKVISSTSNLGRGLGRLVTYAGWALLAIDVIQLLIEVYEVDKKNNKVTFHGFGGGASGYW
ncbi:hypothetical protein ETU08_00745 [Apibacter muscae]|uniref:hypothetical protein n=1 Tax=Apibacter muscae TaxID=2509004 RepID=UPI0011AD782B|nr:hypothetical protein [Apibacter muscae]TWP31559.1 hypothetical protein ETU08_00745 [Apibacter muscae]